MTLSQTTHARKFAAVAAIARSTRRLASAGLGPQGEPRVLIVAHPGPAADALWLCAGERASYLAGIVLAVVSTAEAAALLSGPVPPGRGAVVVGDGAAVRVPLTLAALVEPRGGRQ